MLLNWLNMKSTMPNYELVQLLLVSTHKRMRINNAPIISTATSIGGKTDEMITTVKVINRVNCKKGSMWRGSTVSTSS